MDARRLIPVTLVTLVLGIAVSPIASADGRGSTASPMTAAAAGRYIAVRTLGTARNESSDPLRQRFTFPLSSLVDGSVVGTATDDIACSQSTPPPCAVIDAITTFRFTQGMFPLGTIINHAQVSIAPDVQRPGFIVNGARSSQPTIQSGTGAYAGRSGTVVLSGANDIRSFPTQLSQDDLWLIELQ